MAKKYKIIYADPPWRYEFSPTAGRAIEKHYPTMHIDDIKALPIDSISDNDSILFIWGTWPKLLETISVIQAWGFNYRTVGFVWVKLNKKQDLSQTSFLPSASFNDFLGMGNYTRSNSEFCLIGTKGKPKTISNSVRQIIFSKIREHSRKPDEARQRILELMGDLPRIELFARAATLGWDVYGNEAQGSIDLGI
jgi:N6-adenosine-specific RNA methylase IME4